MNSERLPLDIIRRHSAPWRTPGICPVRVADKLKAIRELRAPELSAQLDACPRLVELLWFLQWRSHQPGGLEKFVQEFLLEFPEHLRTSEMVAIGWPRSGRHSLENCVRIWGTMPPHGRRPFRESSASPDAREFQRRSIRLREEAEAARQLRDGLNRLDLPIEDTADVDRCATDLACLLRGDFSELRKIDLKQHPNAALLVETLTPEYFWKSCAEAALVRLPSCLAALATDLSVGFNIERRSGGVWYFEGLIEHLFTMMDRHAARERAAIAATTVSEMILDRFEFAKEMKANVLIVGDARLGKSTSSEANCRMRPGAWRLVTVPQGNRRQDFIEAHAKAMHLVFQKKPSFAAMEEAVVHVLRHGEFLIAYDEFHAAVPDRLDKDRAPWRLNWIRGNVVDRNLGVIFSATRQTYSQALRHFLKNTRWAIEQHAGRLHDTVSFGTDAGDTEAAPVLNRQDVIKITELRFPDISADVREQIAIAAYRTSAPPQSIDALAKAAKWKARKAGRSTPSTQDAQEAIDEWQSRTSHEDIELGAPGVQQIRAQTALGERRGTAGSEPQQRSRPAAAAMLPDAGRARATTFPPDEESSPSRLPSDHATAGIA